ncbi:MAG: methylated-DNA--[protein]-cysteine S-methyltransferase [Clostridiales Family XIII bacterium]|jgi:methylated-DNA-[protein]-cysteine S-methyltransferase|nr:methylated-DNA--[protein]-cysteine S-methyltransferase [Clostridiales Family XIII bacterium]
MYYRTIYPSPVGELTLACDDTRLVGLWIAGEKYFGCGLPADARQRDDAPVFRQTRDWLNRYFAGGKPAADELPLAPAGSAFRQDVWRILCGIPYGEVRTYGGIAKTMEEKAGTGRMSAQAVGGAVGHNPISIIIPCHRVVGTDGSLTGYAGGIRTKEWLLAQEGVDMTRYYVPPKGTAL